MARNVEIKARVVSIASLAVKSAHMANAAPVDILQDDTFFNCEQGRLKLRTLDDGTGVLIFYRRENALGPKESFYECARTDEPDALRTTLSLAYGQAGRVRKHRTVFLAGRTRIHLDCVQGLGDFLELEVELGDGETAESGVEEAHELMRALGISDSQLVDGAYVDLLGIQEGVASERTTATQ